MRHLLAKVAKIAGGVTLAFIGMAPAAAADPIDITTGAISLSRQDNAGLRFSGSGFASSGEMGSVEGAVDSYNPPYFCGYGESCTGATFNLSMSDSLERTPSQSSGYSVRGPFLLDGTEYFYERFDYSITAGDIIAPSNDYASTWFRFAGTIVGRTADGASRTLQLTGRGRATTFWHQNDGWLSTTYQFDPAPVPEPATMILLGSGLAVLVGARKRLGLRR